VLQQRGHTRIRTVDVKPLDEWYQKTPRASSVRAAFCSGRRVPVVRCWRRNFGLIGRLTRDHRLGTVADSSGPVRLADEIERMVVCGPRTFIDLSSTTTFVLSRTPKRFPSTVLSGGIGAAA
jgi:hypothetical protein